MRLLLATLCLTASSLTAAAPAFAQTAPAAPKQYSAAQFFETESISIAGSGRDAYTHDGKHLLVSSDRTGTFNAYLLPVAGGDAIPLTRSTTDAIYAVSVFPMDGRVLVERDNGGDELSHLFVRAADGTLTDITPGEKLKAQFVGWTADGSRFFVATNGRDAKAFDVYAYDAATLKPTLVYQNDGSYSPAAVSGDGKTIALSKELTSANSDVYLVDTAGGAPRLVTRHEGNVSYSITDFTPDSKKLVLTSDETGEFARAFALDIAGGAKTELVRGDWDVMFAYFSPGGRYRVSALNADGSTALTILDTRTGKPVPLTGVPAGDLSGVRFNADETRMAFTVASDTSPRDVFIADLAAGTVKRLTHTLNPAIAEADLVQARVVRYEGEGGVKIPGILYQPKTATAANPAPAIVLVHGGPGGQSRRGYSAMVQHLVNHGYAVLAANNRGSSGYGKTFFHLDDKKHGEADLRDIVAGGNWLRAQPWVAKDKVAVMGGSYGGYITAAALAFHPDAFTAGIDIFGVTNWVRTLKSIPPWWGAARTALYDEMGDPATDEERHRRISPLFHADKIRRPLLVIQGKNDPRVLQVESDELVAAVKKNNVPVEYVVFPDEGHGFQSRANRITAQEAYLKFLDTYVRK